MQVLEIFHWLSHELNCGCLRHLGFLKWICQWISTNSHRWGKENWSPSWGHTFWGALSFLIKDIKPWGILPHKLDESLKSQRWVYLVALCQCSIVFFIMLIFWRKCLFFLLKNVVRNLKFGRFQPAVFLIWCPFRTLLCCCQKYIITSLERKPYCQILLILHNYIKILGITLACWWLFFPL